ncbi:MAG: MerR family transcriptional regulator [Candidatus Omnitrophica bacterium]|nr:MerR family transcriptional regulator [Candidatus Omnitrophota bacterium]
MVTAIKEDLLRLTEFLKYLKSEGIDLTDRMLRYYISFGIFPQPERIFGEGNVCYYRKEWVDRIKITQLLVRIGKSLTEVKSIITSIKDSEKEVLDYLSAYQHAESLTYITEQLKEGKKLNQIKKDKIVKAKELYLEEFHQKFGAKYKRLTDNFFHVLLQYKDLFPADWSREKILAYFGFKPENIDFNDRKEVRSFKMNFYKQLANFLKQRRSKLNKQLDDGIEFCETSIKGFERIIKDS